MMQILYNNYFIKKKNYFFNLLIFILCSYILAPTGEAGSLRHEEGGVGHQYEQHGLQQREVSEAGELCEQGCHAPHQRTWGTGLMV